MGIKTFAAIYIGSYEVSLKIFELSQRRGIRAIDFVRSRVELGKDTYTTGTIGYELVEELCQVLQEFCRIMEGYRVDDYMAYASGGIRDVSNELFILDQIRLRTKLNVQVLSNSEHRFLSYKSLASDGMFEKMIQEGAAVADVGGGSMQITLFWKGNPVTTQHIVLGTMRILEKLSGIESLVAHYGPQIHEMVDKELEIFRKLYLPGKEIKYVILVGDYISEIMKGSVKARQEDVVETERFVKTMNKLEKKNFEVIAEELNLADEHDPLFLPSVVLYKSLAEELGAAYVWAPGVNISDGIAYDYAEKNRIIKAEHDFEEDVINAAKNLSQRYHSFTEHTKLVLDIATSIYDAMRKVHGMGKRERLLLQTAALLHDCGRYISLVNQSECSYLIVMASELIGMTHLEREIVASTVRYNSNPLVPYENLADKMDQESYMVVAKLAAIIKIANAMDRSHRQKYKNVVAALKGKQLLITVEAKENLVLEKGLFSTYADSFEQIFSVKPMIKEKRVLN